MIRSLLELSINFPSPGTRGDNWSYKFRFSTMQRTVHVHVGELLTRPKLNSEDPLAFFVLQIIMGVSNLQQLYFYPKKNRMNVKIRNGTAINFKDLIFSNDGELMIKMAR